MDDVSGVLTADRGVPERNNPILSYQERLTRDSARRFGSQTNSTRDREGIPVAVQSHAAAR